MAERRDLNDRREGDDLNRRVGYGGAGWFAWWWIWILIFIGIIWFAGWGWGGYGGWWGGGRRAANTVIIQPQTTGSGVAVLNSSNRSVYIGQPFDLYNAPVQKVVNNHALWVGVPNSKPVLVVTNGNNTNNNAITQGSRINVQGTVEKAPTTQQARQNWNLNEDGADQLHNQGVYVQGSSIQKVS